MKACHSWVFDSFDDFLMFFVSRSRGSNILKITSGCVARTEESTDGPSVDSSVLATQPELISLMEDLYGAAWPSAGSAGDI